MSRLLDWINRNIFPGPKPGTKHWWKVYLIALFVFGSLLVGTVLCYYFFVYEPPKEMP